MNPFHSLYVTEKVAPEEFVKLFSPQLVSGVQALYRPGNVVLRGMQGTGKSMLLNLLKPEVRIAYHEAAISFPIASETPFIGCGINLLKSRAFELGQRSNRVLSDEPESIGIIFGDFLNYFICYDLLRSVRNLGAGPATLQDEIGLSVDDGRLDAWATSLAASDVWFGYLDGVKGIDDLERLLIQRIRTIRSFVNRNTDRLPNEVASSRTSAGEPLSQAVRLLGEHNVLAPTTEVFVRIDQYEELYYLQGLADDHSVGAVQAMQGAVHKMMGVRDERLSYRIGARRFAWPEAPTRLGGSAPLENLRDYVFVDLDNALREKENSGKSYFMQLARDIFARRLELSGYDLPSGDAQAKFQALVGRTPDKDAKARNYLGPQSSPIGKVAGRWSTAVERRLVAIRTDSPLDGALALAWASGHSRKKPITLKDLDKEPWRKYWARDRVDQALLQIAASTTQRMRWYGDQDILRLSDGNPLAFVSLCKSLFDCAERDDIDVRMLLAESEEVLSPALQNEAVYETADVWFDKLAQAYGGQSRQIACTKLGNWARNALRSDTTMSRPGHNGFSVEEVDLQSEPQFHQWLREAVDQGALIEMRHTSRSGGPRLKYYLPPILCPRFQIPSTRRKEPLYLRASDAHDWLLRGGPAPRLNVEKTSVPVSGRWHQSGLPGIELET